MNAYYLSLKPETPNNDYWDYGLLNDFINGRLWKTYEWIDFETHEVDKLPKMDKAIVVVPARHHAGLEEKINNQLQRIKTVVLFLMGDEEADFDISKLQHDNLFIWVQNAHPDKHEAYDRIGTGYPPRIRELDNTKYEKNIDVYFSGQITHKRRQEMLDSLLEFKNAEINKTRGFTQGVEQDIYFKKMANAKVVPCPAGAVIPDSFRTFESLECMAIPVADDRNSQGTIDEYWDWLFQDTVPFPRIGEPDEWYGKVEKALENYDELVQEQTAWWINYKRNFAYKVMGQLK